MSIMHGRGTRLEWHARMQNMIMKDSLLIFLSHSQKNVQLHLKQAKGENWCHTANKTGWLIVGNR